MNRCPCCSAFISLRPYINFTSDYVFCRSCGSTIHVPSYFFNEAINTDFVSYLHNGSAPDLALVAGTRGAETRPLEARGEAFQNDPQGNALSFLLPNGKIQKPSKSKTASAASGQLALFGGAI